MRSTSTRKGAWSGCSDDPPGCSGRLDRHGEDRVRLHRPHAAAADETIVGRAHPGKIRHGQLVHRAAIARSENHRPPDIGVVKRKVPRFGLGDRALHARVAQQRDQCSRVGDALPGVEALVQVRADRAYPSRASARSTPSTEPVAPTRSAATSAEAPVPQQTSRTRAPGRNSMRSSASWIAVIKHSASTPSESVLRGSR